MSSANKRFRRSLNKRYLDSNEKYGLFRYGRMMSMKYARGYCNHHNCLLCTQDFKEKHCTKCKHFTRDLINAY